MLRLKTALVSSAVATLIATGATPANAAVNCADLASLKIPANEIELPSGGATIASAQIATVPADPANPGTTRDYCKVLGAVAPVDPNAPPVNFEVNLPADWNGKAVQYGGGGSNGVLITGLARRAARYACAGGARLCDLGHRFRPRQQEACRAAGVCAQR
jgi:feruloyl esterase